MRLHARGGVSYTFCDFFCPLSGGKTTLNALHYYVLSTRVFLLPLRSSPPLS